MRRRLTAAMTLMVAAALVLAGIVTLILTIRGTRTQTRNQLLQQAQTLARGVRSESRLPAVQSLPPGVRLRALLRLIKAPLSLNGEAVVIVTPAGHVMDAGAPRQVAVLPSGLSDADLDPASLLAGHDVTGSRGAVVYAAVPFSAPSAGAGVEAAVLTRRPPTGLATAGPWFLIAGSAAIIAAFGVADRLGRRIVRPLEAAQEVTARIAGGDLDARVPEPPGADAELAALARSVNAMAESLQRSRGLERQFLMSVSHDLRTPLTSIRGFAEAISDGAVTDTARAAGIITTEARRLERLVRDLLELAKLDARRFSLDMRPVPLGEVVADTAEGFLPAAEELGLALTVETEAASVVADADRLAQVVANLVENALAFATTEVRVGVAGGVGEASVWVSDDGPGIPAEELPHVFERLHSSGRLPGRPVGSGLGLAIVWELVTAMGGAVRAERAPGTGTRMVVSLRAAALGAPLGEHR